MFLKILELNSRSSFFSPTFYGKRLPMTAQNQSAGSINDNLYFMQAFSFLPLILLLFCLLPFNKSRLQYTHYHARHCHTTAKPLSFRLQSDTEKNMPNRVLFIRKQPFYGKESLSTCNPIFIRRLVQYEHGYCPLVQHCKNAPRPTTFWHYTTVSSVDVSTPHE